MRRLLGIGLGLSLALALLTFSAALLTPSPAEAQQWSPEQQEVVDHLKTCWDTWMESVHAGSPDAWLNNCADNHSFWVSQDGSPGGEDYLRRDWDAIAATDEGWLDIRPLWIRVEGDFAVMHFWGYWRVRDQEQPVEVKRTEVFKKVDGRWKLIAGHATRTSG